MENTELVNMRNAELAKQANKKDTTILEQGFTIQQLERENQELKNVIEQGRESLTKAFNILGDLIVGAK
ncbi:hypothetical protein [Herbiconiux daphne]|uniref:Uncharacterized protein n=1 Tax=Herbiconiux daphne TaxID=2970914 RepID=A0ABT2HB00_9MICO|nr:hypothetical protein [Herbiconiux daphne]MCS5737120.1 hypothetical protein [Herbiconiux daphne]